MLLAIPIIYGVVAAAALVERGCDSDNCLRAVRASAYPTRLGTVDCSSYFLATVTPATSTFTSTVTNVCVATAGAKRARHEPRDVILGRQTTIVPSSIPAYASACSGSVGYSSACSCLGVTASTTTAPTPSTTITVTTTSTVAPPTLTVIQFLDFDCVGPETITPAPYGVCTETDASNSTSFLSFSGDAATAAACTVNFYEGLTTNCEGPTFGSASVTSTQCIDFSQIGDIELVCPSC